MTDTKRLKAAMILAGVTAKMLGEAEGWTAPTTYRKINNQTDWLAKEIAVCKELLNLSTVAAENIFFSPYVNQS